MILLLLACSGGGDAPAAKTGWTIEGALSPVLAALDTNDDGKVTSDEWAAAAHEGPPFDVVDRDRDGVLANGELAQWMDLTDPLVFDNPKDRRVPDQRASAMIYPRTWMERMEADRYAFAQQLAGAGATNPWPDAKAPTPPVAQPVVEDEAPPEREGPRGPGRRGPGMRGAGMRGGPGPGPR